MAVSTAYCMLQEGLCSRGSRQRHIDQPKVMMWLCALASRKHVVHYIHILYGNGLSRARCPLFGSAGMHRLG